MKKDIKRVKIFTNDNVTSKNVAKELQEKLQNQDYQIVDKNPHLAIAIGGDGAFLRMVKSMKFSNKCLYVGIHTGTLGFLQEIKSEELDLFIEKILKKEYKVEEVGIQETILYQKNQKRKFLSFNEIVIRDYYLNCTRLNITIDNYKLEHFVGDGILISTSMGSTAYNLSFGGSIVHSSIHALQITPIAPLNSKTYNSLRNSVIIPENSTITIIPTDNSSDLLLTVDGTNTKFKNVKKVTTRTYHKKIHSLRLENYNFYERVMEKLLEK